MQQHSRFSRSHQEFSASYFKHATQRLAFGVVSLVLLVLLAACGGGGSGGTANATPTTGSNGGGSISSPTPSIALQTTTAHTYSISYPQTWKKTGTGDDMTFQDSATSGNSLSIVVTPDPNGAASADTVANTAVQAFSKTLTNGKVVTIPATITIGGVTWSQRAVMGTTKVAHQNVLIKAVLLTAVHNGQVYQIIYGGPVLTFDLINALNFQPMLQSFKFTA